MLVYLTPTNYLSLADVLLDRHALDLIGNFLYMGGRNLASVEDDDELETPVLRPLVWMGNAKRNLQAFPRGAQKSIGDELQLIQFGGMPKDAKPFKGVGQRRIRDRLAL